MIRQLFRARRRQVLIDIGTQKDLFLAEGSYCIRNHRRILANVRRIMAWARSRNVPVISICEVHPRSNGVTTEPQTYPAYCIDGTEGQQKIRYTLLANRLDLPADSKGDLPEDILRRYRQIILHSRCPDPFDEPRIDRLLSEMRAGEFILIGAEAEGSVKATALGLLQRGKKVSVVVDAVGSHNKTQGRLSFRKMNARGAALLETKKLAGTSHLMGAGICHCRSCRQQFQNQKLKSQSTVKVAAEI